MPQETRDKIAEKLKGRKMSEETRKKMSESQKAAWAKIPVLENKVTFANDDIKREWDSLRAYASNIMRKMDEFIKNGGEVNEKTLKEIVQNDGETC